MQFLDWVQQNPELAAMLISAVLAVASLFVPGLSSIVARLIALFLQYNSQFRKVLQEVPTVDTQKVLESKSGPVTRAVLKTPAGKKAAKQAAKKMGVDLSFLGG